MYGMSRLLTQADPTVHVHRWTSQCLLSSKLKHLLLRRAAQVHGMSRQRPQCLS